MLEYFLSEHPITSLIIIIAIVTAIAVAAVALPVRYATEHQCSKRAAMLQTDYQYDLWTGCWVKDKDGSFVEYNTIRNVGKSNNGRDNDNR